MKEKKKEEIVTEDNSKKEEITFEISSNKKGKKKLVIGLILTLLLIGGALAAYFVFFNGKKDTDPKKETKKEEDKKKSAYYITDNSIQDFDLHFLQLENEEKNKIYSPLSIKYALQMLKEGSDGETKTQIESVIGDYKGHKYTNSSNLSLANGLFIKESYKDSIIDSYKKSLSDKYNADVVVDSFSSPDTLNNWVNEKTLGLIKNMFGDEITSLDYVLVNALGIDMEWVNKIQPENKIFHVDFEYEKYRKNVENIGMGFHKLLFNDLKESNSVEIAAVANRYDIVKTLGKDKIADTLKNEYQKWLDEGAMGACPKNDDYTSNEFDVEESGQAYVDKNLDMYISGLEKNKDFVDSSTDFLWYTDDNIKVFAKDLKEYDGTTLEYVGIMPTKDSLSNYITNIKSKDINNIITNLKSVKLDSFKDGVITELYGYIPLFNFEYKLDLMADLKKMGISDVFDGSKADLSKLTTNKSSYISDAEHKANIEFTNDGIKASAVTALGGRGGGDCGFLYEFDVPVEKIDLTFDKPYLFLIIDKSTKEVWFTGTVYEPDDFQNLYN